ncbi:hypothetical protein TraAM80_03949 [Trypanosoma rangeli]|uniref:Uncharacterized protein n=1 Tax=Trypanosoma rangeli TaxID=5698 RepID=A0A422NLQ5_TRYRA|nr:uncharacterized protein TraAM80_03949 [Trypanosoma rangeli]RNF06376.1 hypothetical protein TraAM80_03949 [Trypanosoma rangeli]|eukprot:RNF06376.1 hypothetical protein TraAM80_03949 [Trypanosoma rangeli]
MRRRPQSTSSPRCSGYFRCSSWLGGCRSILAKTAQRRGARTHRGTSCGGTEEDAALEVRETRRLLSHFEPFFTCESKVIPNGALLYTVQTFRFPTPRGPRCITRALVEAPGKYFSPLQEDKGGGHFLCCYEEKRLLRRFTYLQLDKLRFAWVAVKELLEEHKAVQRTDGTLTGLARRDIKNNNAISNDVANGDANGAGSLTTAGTVGTKAGTTTAATTPAALPPTVMRKPHPSSNVIVGPTAEARKTREGLQERKYMSDLLKEECAARWPHTPVHKSVVFTVEEQQLEVEGGRKGRKGPRTYLATVELPLLNKKGGVAVFRGTQWCTTRKDAENAASEAALRALRAIRS